MKTPLNKVLKIRNHVPFDIQTEIIRKLPVKSVVQFRSVSKQWKSFIDCPEFIKNYHINHPNPQRHLIIQYNDMKIDSDPIYTSIIDDNTFPQQKFPLTAPLDFNFLTYTPILSSVDGLLCVQYPEMVVLWNPSIRKYVSIGIPKLNMPVGYTVIAFGICPETSDPKLVKINVVKTPTTCWEVQVFTLSSRVWKTVYTCAPFKSYDSFSFNYVSIDGIIYWHNICSFYHGSFTLSYDLKSDEFAQVSIPENFVHTDGIWVAKVNESLGLLEYKHEGEMLVCGVWMRKDGVKKPFTKMYTIKSVSSYGILGFRNNGEVVIEMEDEDDDDSDGSHIEIYEPSSGSIINNVGISGKRYTFTVCSYVETLLLLDESNSIIQ